VRKSAARPTRAERQKNYFELPDKEWCPTFPGASVFCYNRGFKAQNPEHFASMNEADTCRILIRPKLEAAG